MTPFAETVIDIVNRTLLQRVLVISKSTIKTSSGAPKTKRDAEAKMQYDKLRQLSREPAQIKKLRTLIADEVGDIITVYDLWIDLPAPKFS
jgi:hypothetical protein